MEKYHAVESYYADMLGKVRDEIFNAIRGALNYLGGRVCPRHYHEWADIDRNTFFECDGDGYGRELFLDTIITKEDGDIEVMLRDSEDCYEPWWELSDFNASNALYLLRELEAIIDYVDRTGEKVVTDYDEDFDPDEIEQNFLASI